MAKKRTKRVKTRDYFIVAIILGATKAAVHKDHKKEQNRKACRKKVRKDDV